MMKFLSKSRIAGVIVPTALFVAMFVLMLSTLLIASVSYNFSLSLNSIEATEFRYISFAAVNETLSRMNRADEGVEELKQRPRVSNVDGRITETWIEELDDEGKTVIVSARTYRGTRGTAQLVRRLAVFRENSMGRVYTNSPDEQKNTPDAIYFSDVSESGSWTELPAVPKMRYSDSGTLQTVAGETAGTIPYMAAAPDGSVYGLYAPVLDGWQDHPVSVLGILNLNLGDTTLNTIVNATRQGMTVGDIQPIAQIMVIASAEISVAKGVVPLKFDHETNEWSALPPLPEAVYNTATKQFDIQDSFKINGFGGPPSASEKGLAAGVYRKGQDAIYRYSDETKQWSVMPSPDKDIINLTTDQDGAVYVQSGRIGMPPSIFDLLPILSQINLSTVLPVVYRSGIDKYNEGVWTHVDNPPDYFYDQSGTPTQRGYGPGGPRLGSMVGGKKGELFVVNRPPLGSGLADTLYKYTEREGWVRLPSPPNKSFDSSGNEVDNGGVPKTMELGVDSEGRVMLRLPNINGADAIFRESEVEGEYDLLPPVRGASGSVVQFLSQMAAGQKGDGSGRGTYLVRATYF